MMTKHCLRLLVIGAAFGSAAVAAQPQHPTLSTNWIATTWQPDTPAPSGEESYRFVDKPLDSNPSTLWSNYTAADCKRLLISKSYEDQIRYYLKCHAVDCCKCDTKDAGDQIEFQIPNVHPNWIAPIKYTKGPCDFPASGQPTVPNADIWTWKFGPAQYIAYTTTCPTCNLTASQPGPGVELLRWDIHIAAQNITIEWQDYIIPADTSAFKGSFDVPAVCQGNILDCCNTHEQTSGRLTPVERVAAFMKKHGLPGNATSW